MRKRKTNQGMKTHLLMNNLPAESPPCPAFGTHSMATMARGRQAPDTAANKIAKYSSSGK
jgi:hypothetical protein